jgi:2-oxoglutarate dehydrogenase E1 component
MLMADGSSSNTCMNLEFVEAIYVDYLKDPSSVPESFRRWFDNLEPRGAFEEKPQLGPTFTPPDLFGGNKPRANGSANTASLNEGAICEPVIKQERLGLLVRAYRERGHLAAKLDPLGLPRPLVAELEPEYHGLSADDYGAHVYGSVDLSTRHAYSA